MEITMTNKDTNPEYLFTYGTLRNDSDIFKDWGLSAYLEYVKDATIIGSLYSVNDWYPALVEGDEEIQGQLFKIKDISILQSLDRYEQYNPENVLDSLYTREVSPEGYQYYKYNMPVNYKECKKVIENDWQVYKSKLKTKGKKKWEA